MMETGSYDRDENRNVHVWLPAVGSQPHLFMRIVEFLENIKLGTEHKLQGLQSGRQKRREEAAAAILAGWISNEVRQTVAEWGLTLTNALVEEHGFHMLELTLKNGDKVIETYRLDGWSGLMSRNGLWARERMASADCLGQIILDRVDIYLEAITA